VSKSESIVRIRIANALEVLGNILDGTLAGWRRVITYRD
jgi:hypothetical protein